MASSKPLTNEWKAQTTLTHTHTKSPTKSTAIIMLSMRPYDINYTLVIRRLSIFNRDNNAFMHRFILIISLFFYNFFNFFHFFLHLLHNFFRAETWICFQVKIWIAIVWHACEGLLLLRSTNNSISNRVLLNYVILQPIKEKIGKWKNWKKEEKNWRKMYNFILVNHREAKY